MPQTIFIREKKQETQIRGQDKSCEIEVSQSVYCTCFETQIALTTNTYCTSVNIDNTNASWTNYNLRIFGLINAESDLERKKKKKYRKRKYVWCPGTVEVFCNMHYVLKHFRLYLRAPTVSIVLFCARLVKRISSFLSSSGSYELTGDVVVV